MDIALNTTLNMFKKHFVYLILEPSAKLNAQVMAYFS